MPSSRQDEKRSWSIANQFLKAVERLENFGADPEMIYEDMLIVVHSHTDPRVKETMKEIVGTLRNLDVNMED